jgi:aspartate aminotransferase
MQTRLNDRLLNILGACRDVLAGKDALGKKCFPGMFDEGVISFSHGEGMRRPHPLVIIAGMEALTNIDTGSIENYLFLQSCGELDDGVRMKFSESDIPSQFTDQLCIDAGVTRLIQSFLWSCSERGSVFLTGPSFYHPLPVWCENFGVKLEVLPTSKENDYKVTPQDLMLWAQRNRNEVKRLKGFFLFNPTMTGAVYSRQELSSLIPFIREHRLCVFEDAIFMGTEYNGQPADHLLAIPDCPDSVVLATGASKHYNMANLRIGWACGDAAVISKMREYGIASSASIPQVAKVMAAAALVVPRTYYSANTEECVRRLAVIRACIDQINEELFTRYPDYTETMKIEHDPHAAHSLLINFNSISGLKTRTGQTIHTSLDITRFFLEQCRVSFAPALSHGLPGCRNRVSFACVGLAETYAESQYWEQQYINRFIPFRERAVLPAFEGFSRSNNGWEGGRNKIRSALLEHILPVLQDLLRYNCKRSVSSGVHQRSKLTNL